MKKIVFLFVIIITLISCSDNDDNSVSALVLQKVVFYHSSTNERHWNISNNLLTNITLADGAIVEKFTYDEQNRVISDIKYEDGIVSETTNIVYNSENTIKSINGLDYNFDSATQTYTYSGTFSISCQLNSDKLAVNYTRTGSNAGAFHMTYANGNMTSFEKSNGGVTDVVKNFNFNPTAFGTNPIYNAVLAVARVKSLTDPNFFIDCQASKEIPNGFDKGSTDPYYYNYGLVADSKISYVGVEVLDSNNNSVADYSFADYYYQ